MPPLRPPSPLSTAGRRGVAWAGLGAAAAAFPGEGMVVVGGHSRLAAVDGRERTVVADGGTSAPPTAVGAALLPPGGPLAVRSGAALAGPPALVAVSRLSAAEAWGGGRARGGQDGAAAVPGSKTAQIRSAEATLGGKEAVAAHFCRTGPPRSLSRWRGIPRQPPVHNSRGRRRGYHLPHPVRCGGAPPRAGRWTPVGVVPLPPRRRRHGGAGAPRCAQGRACTPTNQGAGTRKKAEKTPLGAPPPPPEVV